MKRLWVYVALPAYAVAIGVELCVLAYKLVRWERGMKAAAKEAEAQHRGELRREQERERAKVSEENEWGIN